MLAHHDPGIRKVLRWCYDVGRRAWFFEVRDFLFRRHRAPADVTLGEFWGAAQDSEEEALAVVSPTQARLTGVGTANKTLKLTAARQIGFARRGGY